MVEEFHGLRNGVARVRILALPFIACAVLGRLLQCSVPQFTLE